MSSKALLFRSGELINKSARRGGLHIVDTAGLRDGGDAIEQEGIKRAWREMESADRILLVVDYSEVAAGDPAGRDRAAADAAERATDARDANKPDADPDLLWPELHLHLPHSIPVTIIYNKCDLSEHQPNVCERDETSIVILSAKTGAGLDLLRQHLKQAMGYEASGEHQFMARRRHLEALEDARGFLQSGQAQLRNMGAGELLAEDLRQCHNALGQITGAISSDALLGEIFSSFCIGK